MASFNMSFNEGDKFNASFNDKDNFNASFGEVQKTSTSNYEELFNLPKIEHNTLIGDKTFAELGLLEITPQEIDDMFDELIYGGG